MADHYSQCAFIIPCTEQEALIAIDAFKHITNRNSKHAISVVATSKERLNTPAEQIIHHCLYQHTQQKESIPDYEMKWEFDVSIERDGLSIQHHETIDGYQAAVFAQAVLKAFNKPDLIEISIADNCSRPIHKAFGGRGYCVTQHEIRSHDLHLFWESEIKAHNLGEHYYVCSFIVVCGGLENKVTFLLKDASGQECQSLMVMAIEKYKCIRKSSLNQFVTPNIIESKITTITPIEYTMLKMHLETMVLSA